jgi:hypothetical protein
MYLVNLGDLGQVDGDGRAGMLLDEGSEVRNL